MICKVLNAFIIGEQNASVIFVLDTFGLAKMFYIQPLTVAKTSDTFYIFWMHLRESGHLVCEMLHGVASGGRKC